MQDRHTFGILELDDGLPAESHLRVPRPGSLFHPMTFGHQVLTEIVHGAWPDLIIRGDTSIQGACVAAARRLADRGAGVISADCGFFIRHQQAIAAAVNVPVVTSSLLLVPSLLRQLRSDRKLAVVTADSTHFGEDLLGLDCPTERARVVVGGIEGGEYLSNSVMRPPLLTSVSQIEKEVTECIVKLRTAHPDIALLLLECTGFPYVANAIRLSTGLPVYDITDLCRLAIASVA